jgi:adenylate kinase
MVRIILFGAPGAGKGTQADLIEEDHGYKKISAGDLIRAEVNSQSKIGIKVEEIIARGELVPDETIINLVKKRVEKDDIVNGYIMDGFPRTINQAQELSRIPVDREITIFLKVDEQFVADRLLSRWTCKNCEAIYNEKNKPPQKEGICDECGGILMKRTDDNLETISKRIQIYNQETMPVVHFYREKGNLHEVDSSRSIHEVFSEIKDILK